MLRCQTADNVTWLDDKAARFQFRVSRELIGEASSVNVNCDASLCRHGNDAAAAEALPQVWTLVATADWWSFAFWHVSYTDVIHGGLA